MTCAHCCDANNFFDAKNASKELKKYRKKGPWGTTSKIIALLDKIDMKGKTMLDIGGGIGALQWYFLNGGGKSTVAVDASSGYLEASKSYASEMNWQDKTEFIEGDFNDLANSVQASDFVALDKVICCYPDYDLILQNAIAKTKEYLILSYPISNWISKTLNRASYVFFFFKKTSFRTFIHPSRQIRSRIESQGFEKVDYTLKFPWHIEIYRLKTAFSG